MIAIDTSPSSPAPRRDSRASVPGALLLAILVVFGVSVSGSMSSVAATDHAPGARAEAAAPRGSWRWPVGGVRHVLRAFERPASDFSAGHRGIDAASPAGTIVTAPADGTVLFAGPVAGRSVVTIEHAPGLVSSFDPVLPAVEVGTVVSAGEPIGRLEAGPAMHCPSGCLHIGLRLNGEYLDPLPFFRPPARAILLPLGE